MGPKSCYEFNKKTRDEIYRRHRHEFPDDAELEIDHIVSVRECIEKGIPPWIASNIINAQLLTKKENREKSDKDADPVFVDYLLSLIVKIL